MIQLSATRCSCIAILWVSLVSFVAITLCVPSQWVITKVSVDFFIDSVRKLLDTPSYVCDKWTPRPLRYVTQQNIQWGMCSPFVCSFLYFPPSCKYMSYALSPLSNQAINKVMSYTEVISHQFGNFRTYNWIHDTIGHPDGRFDGIPCPDGAATNLVP
jgi:hypothetical protein